MTILTNMRARAAVAVVAAAIGAGGCTLEEASAPAMTAPSEFGLSVTLTASPAELPRDGGSQSVVSVLVRDDRGRPVTNQRLSVSTNVGRVLETSVTTNAEGRASFTFVAPDASVSDNRATIFVTPLGTDAASAIPRPINIGLTGTNGVASFTAPTAAFTFSPEAPVLGENVVFDASTSTDEGVTCLDVCTYTWDFGGEATRTGRIVTYQFQQIRTYPVRLTVRDGAGSSGTLTTNVVVAQGTAPTATFTFSPTSPGQRQTVNFTAEASRPGVPGRTITSYQWRFGDGGTATGVTTTHAYDVVGTYPVVLTVTDSAGVQTTATQNITVVAGVTAAFTFTTLPSRVVIFNAESSRGSDSGFGTRNPIVRYIWHWGEDTDTEDTTSPIIRHEFDNAIAHTVTLTVVDSLGRRETTNQAVTPID
jgi:PKD repeat protein